MCVVQWQTGIILAKGLIKDKIIIGIRCVQTRKKLMNTHDFILEKTIRMKEMSLADDTDVHVLTNDRKYMRKTENKGPQQGGYRQYH